MRESVTYQAILEEGEAKGMAKGRTEGAVTEVRKLLLLQGTIRFGLPDRPTWDALERIQDLPILEGLGVRLLRVGSWQELLGLRPGRRGRRSGAG